MCFLWLNSERRRNDWRNIIFKRETWLAPVFRRCVLSRIVQDRGGVQHLRPVDPWPHVVGAGDVGTHLLAGDLGDDVLVLEGLQGWSQFGRMLLLVLGIWTAISIYNNCLVSTKASLIWEYRTTDSEAQCSKCRVLSKKCAQNAENCRKCTFYPAFPLQNSCTENLHSFVNV